eukprot:Gb_09328 [translate_table: standard]
MTGNSPLSLSPPLSLQIPPVKEMARTGKASGRGLISITRACIDYRRLSMANVSGDAPKQGAFNRSDSKSRDDDKQKEIERLVMEKIGPPPEKPLPGDCCGNGCEPCVWDTYFDELQLYNQQKDSLLKSLP